MLRTPKILWMLSMLVVLVSAAWAQEPTKQINKQTVAPAAASNPVVGAGTAGQISKWLGVDGSNTFTVGDSNITEDKFGKVGVGIRTPTSPLTVRGMIESTLGGFKFPDGSIQPSSAAGALFVVAHNATLTGNGTAASPLGVALQEGPTQPFAGATAFALTPGADSIAVAFIEVPTGKRFVIEHVTASCDLPVGQRLSTIAVGVRTNGSQSFFDLVPTHIGDFTNGAIGPASTIIASQAMKLYADPGTTVHLAIRRGPATGAASCDGHISGFLVDVP